MPVRSVKHPVYLCILALAAAGSVACSSKKPAAPPQDAGPHKFFWATATAAYQVEGGNHACDWHQWEYQPDGGEWPLDAGTHIANDDHADNGPDEYDLYDQDFALAQSMGNNAARISIEWSRLEPVEGQYDRAALAHYHSVFASMKAHGLEPMVTLQHYTLPTWLNNPYDGDAGYGGWAGRPGDGIGQSAIVSRFARFSGDMAKEYGGEVDYWFTLNEPMVLVAATYLNPTGSNLFPAAPFDSDLTTPLPGVNLGLAVAAAANMIYAHAAAYDAIHANDTIDADGDGKAALVSIAHHVRVFLPGGTDTPAIEAANQLDYVNNLLILNAMILGDLDLNLDGKYDGPGEVQGSPALKGRLDFLGLNYYSFSTVLPDTVKNAQGIAILGLPIDDSDSTYDHSDLGWAIYPQGLHDLVARFWGIYHLPILISENGIADAADTKRARFLVDHVKALEQAQSEGAEVWGYTWWSLVDNFEWARGFAAKFGLYSVDYASQKRTPTQGVAAYQAIIQAGSVTPQILQQYGP